jgi:hypothetical protein
LESIVGTLSMTYDNNPSNQILFLPVSKVVFVPSLPHLHRKALESVLK